MRIKLLGIFLLAALSSFAQNFYTPITMGTYPARIGSFTTLGSVFITNQTRSDTVKVTGTTSGWYLGQVRGVDTLHPFVIYVQGKQTINGGIALENCYCVKIIAPDSVILNSGGVPSVVKGHADFIQRTGFIILNGLNGANWDKTEVSEACNYSPVADWLYPNHMRNLWFTDFRIGDATDVSKACGGDYIYSGSTGSKGDRPVPCLGNALIKPMYMSGVHYLRGKMYFAGRSGIQVSGADSGYNEVKNIEVYNAGRELNSQQGAGIRTGFGTANNIEIAYNKTKYTYLYGMDVETGANVHDNNFDSAGWYTAASKNPQQINTLIVSASSPNSKVIIRDNIIGVSSSSIRFPVYGGNNFSLTDSSIVCGNSVNPTVLSLPFPYKTTCGVIPNDSTLITVFVQHDSLVLGHFPAQYKDTIYVVTRVTKQDTAKHKNKTYTVRTTYSAPVDSAGVVLVRAAYDSAYICSLCAQHDSSYYVPVFQQKTNWGVLIPLNDTITNASQRAHQTKLLGATAARVVYNRGSAYTVGTYKDSGLFVSLTANPVNTSMGSPQPIPANLAPFAASLDSIFAISKPDHICYFNEPILFYSSNTSDTTPLARAQQLIAGLTYLVPHANAAGITTSDGGELMGVMYYAAKYWNDRGYNSGSSDSVGYLSTLSGISRNNLLNSPTALMQQEWYSYIIPNLRATGVTYFNLHWYERPFVPDSSLTTTSGLLPLLISFCGNQSGLPVISDETWIRNYSPALLTSMFTEWKQSNPKIIIGYDGNGEFVRSNKALEDAFSNFIINNP